MDTVNKTPESTTSEIKYLNDGSPIRINRYNNYSVVADNQNVLLGMYGDNKFTCMNKFLTGIKIENIIRLCSNCD